MKAERVPDRPGAATQPVAAPAQHRQLQVEPTRLPRPYRDRCIEQRILELAARRGDETPPQDQPQWIGVALDDPAWPARARDRRPAERQLGPQHRHHGEAEESESRDGQRGGGEGRTGDGQRNAQSGGWEGAGHEALAI